MALVAGAASRWTALTVAAASTMVKSWWLTYSLRARSACSVCVFCLRVLSACSVCVFCLRSDVVRRRAPCQRARSRLRSSPRSLILLSPPVRAGWCRDRSSAPHVARLEGSIQRPRLRKGRTGLGRVRYSGARCVDGAQERAPPRRHAPSKRACQRGAGGRSRRCAPPCPRLSAFWAPARRTR